MIFLLIKNKGSYYNKPRELQFNSARMTKKKTAYHQKDEFIPSHPHENQEGMMDKLVIKSFDNQKLNSMINKAMIEVSEARMREGENPLTPLNKRFCESMQIPGFLKVLSGSTVDSYEIFAGIKKRNPKDNIEFENIYIPKTQNSSFAKTAVEMQIKDKNLDDDTVKCLFDRINEMEFRGTFKNTPTTNEKGRFLELIESSDYLQDKDFTGEEIDKFIGRIALIPGAEKNMELLGANNEQVNKGRYAELVRAFYLEKEGHQVEAIGKIVETPKGKTDIDILLKDGTWIENKQVKEISGDQKLKDKIDKMASAVKKGMEVNGIKIKRAIFINRGKINDSAIDYAISKGIPIFRDLEYSDAPKIIEILPFYKDLIKMDPEIAAQCAQGAYKTFLPETALLQPSDIKQKALPVYNKNKGFVSRHTTERLHLTQPDEWNIAN